MNRVRTDKYDRLPIALYKIITGSLPLEVVCLHKFTYGNGFCVKVTHDHVCLCKFMHVVFKSGVKIRPFTISKKKIRPFSP